MKRLNTILYSFGFIKPTKLRHIFYKTQEEVVLFEKPLKKCTIQWKHGELPQVTVSNAKSTLTKTFETSDDFQVFKESCYHTVFELLDDLKTQ